MTKDKRADLGTMGFGFGLGGVAESADINEVRKKWKRDLMHSPMSDPTRCLLSGMPVRREVIDEFRVLTFPAILFQALPTIEPKGIKHNGAILGAPSGDLTTSRSGIFAAALFRIFTSFDGVKRHLAHGYKGITAECGSDAPSFASEDEHWITNIGFRGGSSSPMMTIMGRTMNVADALMNLAYPCVQSYRFGLRRRCGVARCVNPAHYIQAQPSQEASYVGYSILMDMIHQDILKPMPKYFWDEFAHAPAFTASWEEYLNMNLEHWKTKGSGIGVEFTPQPEAAPTVDTLKTFLDGDLPAEHEVKVVGGGSPSLADLLGDLKGEKKSEKPSMFSAMGGKWAKE